MTHFRDDISDINLYIERWVDVWGNLAYSICAIALLFWIDPVIAALVCVPLFGGTLLIRLLHQTIRKYRLEWREATSRVTDFIGETFAAVQAIKVAGEEDAMTDRLRTLGHERRKRAVIDALLIEMIRAFNNGLVYVGIGLMLTAAAWKMGRGSLSVGDLAVFIQILPRVTQVMSFIGNMMAQQKRAGVAIERMEKLMVNAPKGQLVNPAPLVLTGPPSSFVSSPRRGDKSEDA